MNVGAVLKAELERQGKTAAELIDASGVKRSAANDILSGKTKNPGILTVAALVRGLGRSLAWLETRARK